MNQTYHEKPSFWPLPLSTTGALIEVDYAEIETSLELAGGKLYNTQTARVRALSPDLPTDIKETLLSEGNGSFGARVLFGRDNARYLLEPEYIACGFEVPDPEINGLGDLAFINYERIISVLDNMDGQNPPFKPLGARVFFEYDMDDESIEDVVLDSGIVLREKDLAVDNQLATVTAVGPLCEHVSPGDRVIVKRMHHGVSLDGTDYHFVSNEHEIFAVLRAE